MGRVKPLSAVHGIRVRVRIGVRVRVKVRVFGLVGLGSGLGLGVRGWGWLPAMYAGPGEGQSRRLTLDIVGHLL